MAYLSKHIHCICNIKKIIKLLHLFLFISTATIAQRGYIRTDTSLSYNIKLNNNGDNLNCAYCEQQDKNGNVRFSPYELNEYGFNNGCTYVSKKISVNDSSRRVFLERLTKGPVTLYFYRARNIRTFYIEKDSSELVEIPRRSAAGQKNTYRDQLRDITSDCSYLTKTCHIVKYSKSSMSELIRRFNGSIDKPFPVSRFGISAGIELFKPKSIESSDLLNEFNFCYDMGQIYNIWSDFPLDLSDFSFHPEINFSRHRISQSVINNNYDLDYTARFSSVQMPLLFRYSLPMNKIRPYAEAGGLVRYNKVDNEKYYRADKSGNVIEINEIVLTSIIPEIQWGYSLGIGAEVGLDFRRNLFIGVRYAQLIDFQYSLNYTASVIGIQASVNF